MLLLPTEALAEGADWLYELKLDGHRALTIKMKGQIQLRSRNDDPVLCFRCADPKRAGYDGNAAAHRRNLLDRHILPKREPIRDSPELHANLADLVAFGVRQRIGGAGCEEAPRQPLRAGERSGAWRKMQINKGPEFVIAGYTAGGATVDAVVFGYYQGSKLLYFSRTRNGFTPRVREELLKRSRGLEITECRSRISPRPGADAGGRG